MKQIDRKSHRTKDTLSPLNEVLLRLKPSTFKDNYLASFKVRYRFYRRYYYSGGVSGQGVTVRTRDGQGLGPSMGWVGLGRIFQHT